MFKLLINMYKYVREFFFPILEGEASQYPHLSAEQICDQLASEEDEAKALKLLDLSKDIHEREEKRISTVESKATTLLGAAGLTIALIANFGKSLLFEADNLKSIEVFTVYSFSLMFILTIIYFLISIRYSLKALSRKGFLTLTPIDVIDIYAKPSVEYYKRISSLIMENTIRNYVTSNEKVDYMVMAQEYFKRGIFSIIIVTLFLSARVFINYLMVYISQF